MASIYNNIGNIHLVGERYEEAIENYRLSVESNFLYVYYLFLYFNEILTFF